MIMDQAPIAPAVPAVGSAEQRFLMAVRTGDAPLLERLLLEHAGRAHAQAARTLGSAADADDAVQEAFLQLLRTAQRYDPRIPFPAWLARLVHTACLRVRRVEARRRRRELRAGGGPAVVAGSDPIAEAEDAAVVRSAVATLPGPLREAIALHYFAGLSQQECGAVLGLQENAVAVRIHRGRERLRPVLARRGLASALTPLSWQASPAFTASTRRMLQQMANGRLPRHVVRIAPAKPLLAGLLSGALAIVAGALVAFAAWHQRHQAQAPVADAMPMPSVAALEPLGAGKPALLARLDPDASQLGCIDFAALRALTTVKPISLLADPRAADAVAYAGRQIRLLHDHGCRASIPGARSPSACRDRGLAGVLDFSAKPPTQYFAVPGDIMRLYQHLFAGRPQEDRVADFVIHRLAASEGDPALASDGSCIVLGDRTVLTASLAAQPRPPGPAMRWPEAPVWSILDLRHLVASWSSARPLDQGSPWEPLLGPWRTWAPQVHLRIAPDQGDDDRSAGGDHAGLHDLAFRAIPESFQLRAGPSSRRLRLRRAPAGPARDPGPPAGERLRDRHPRHPGGAQRGAGAAGGSAGQGAGPRRQPGAGAHCRAGQRSSGWMR